MRIRNLTEPYKITTNITIQVYCANYFSVTELRK